MAEFGSSRTAGRVAFTHPDFVLYQIARLLVTVALEMQSVAVGWQVYELTREPLALGLVGLAQFLPGLILFLLSGHAADRIDRRKLIVVCHAGFAVCSASLLYATVPPGTSVSAIYLVLVLIGIVRAFNGPASRAILPQLVPEEHFPNAVAWAATVWQISTLLGPALGGLLYTIFGGPTAVYGAAAVGGAAACVLALRMKPRPRPAEQEDTSVSTVLAGLRYIYQQKLILGAISLDLFAVLFGGAVALLPIYASQILKTGPWGLGVLRSAPAVGAMAVAVFLAHYPLERRVGVKLFFCVAGFGVFTILFGISRNLWLSLAALLIAGGFDMVSVIIRNTLVQITTPDHTRGRVTAVELIFIDASNEFGQFESGVTAQWFGTIPAVILGGVGTLIVTAVWASKFTQLRHADRLARPQDLESDTPSKAASLGRRSLTPSLPEVEATKPN
jgi:MFS family permease